MKNVTSMFKGSLEGLFQMGFQTISLVNRDLNEFGKLGLGQQHADEFSNLVAEFNAIKRDEVYQGELMLITEAKNQIAEQLMSAMRLIMLKVEAACAVNSIMYIQFRNGNISQMTDLELADRARTTVDLLIKWKNKLAPFGLTQADIEEIADLLMQFNLKIREQADCVNTRDFETQLRAIKANELWKQVSYFRNLGRKMWAETNEAYSNDYVMHESYKTDNDNVEVTNTENIDDGTQTGNG